VSASREDGWGGGGHPLRNASPDGAGQTLREAQAAIDAWIRDNGGYWPPLALLARLTEETGEVARAYNHRFGPKRPKPGEGDEDLAGELGDVLWIVLCMANEQGIDLDAQLARVMEKLRVRDAGRHG
jgi:NTP pyrophosphatase (non-canonical NTP hydrolase)